MKRHYFFNIFSISLLIFTIKWFYFFYGDLKLDLITKIVFDLKDFSYFTSIYNLTEFNFNPSYNPNLLDLKLLPFPVYSLFFHSLFYSLFNIYGFIIIEFFIILSFFYIFFKFFIKLGVNNIEAIFLALFIFCLPTIIDYFHLYKIPYVAAIKELYYLRVPRPSVSHLYLFLFFLILITNNKKEEFKYSKLASVGACFAFMWSSFFYNLAFSGIILIFHYFYITHNSKQKKMKYIKDAFIVLLVFLLFSIPTIFLLIGAEPDYLVRVGLTSLDIEKKKILLIHFIEQIISIKFILIFILITCMFFFIKSKNKYKIEGLNLLYFIFLSSFLSPLIFIILSPTISEIYHFSNMLIALIFFVLAVFSFLIILFFIKKFSISQNIIKVFICLFIFIFGIHNHLIAKRDSVNVDKIHASELIREIKKIDINKKSNILTFDGKVQTILILNDYKNFSYVKGVNISLNDNVLEHNIINIFKFLNLNLTDFNNFIKNKKEGGWRFMNNYIGESFYMRYQANRLTTFENSLDFTDEELKFILKSSPLHSQQLIIPAYEIKRLNEKFINIPMDKKIDPVLIIINTNNLITINSIIDDKIYCSKPINDTYIMYSLKRDNPKC